MICRICSEDKQDKEFPFRNIKKGLRDNRCKLCSRKYTKIHYTKNKKDYINRAKADRPNQIRKTKELKHSLKTKCALCNETWPEVLEFHHIDSSKKEIEIGNTQSRKQIIEESKKCIVLCANHHRKFHSGHNETIILVNELIKEIPYKVRYGYTKEENIEV